MLEQPQVAKRGFGLHLAFDDTFDESVLEIARFRDKDYSKEFTFHDLDKVPTCQIDFGTDKKGMEKLVRLLVVDVYEVDLESVEVDSYEI